MASDKEDMDGLRRAALVARAVTISATAPRRILDRDDASFIFDGWCFAYAEKEGEEAV